VVHRDVKPANVMCGSFGDVYLVDWGLARFVPGADPDPQPPLPPRELGSLRADPSLMSGTPGFMSPEQLRGDRAALRPRSDIFSLGSMLFEMLTLRPAFADGPIAEMKRATVEGPVPDPRRAGTALVPDEIAEVCMKALAKRPEDRYADGRELAYAVEQFLEGSH